MENTVALTDFENAVDCFEKDNNLWFRLSDIAKVLEVDKGTATKWKDWADEDEIELRKTQLGGHDIPYASESLLYRILNRTNSPKAKPFERWITKVVIPSIRKQGSYTITQTKTVDPAREKEIGLARAEFLHSMALEYNGKSETYKQILDAYATKELAGEFILPLPEVKQKSYSAGEVGKMLGITATKVGRIANENNLKTENFGHWIHDKSPYSSKEVESFRYYDNAVAEIKKIIENSKE